MNHRRIARRALAAFVLLVLALPASALAQGTPVRKWSDTVYDMSSSSFDRRSGDRDDVVRRIQERLISLGYLNDKADGKFGSKTKKAVELFQRNNGIHGNDNSYGVATQMTQAVLFSGEALAYNSAPRLSSWSMYSSPYSIMRGAYFYEPNGRYCIHFELRNENPTQELTSIVVRYWLQDRNNYLVNYNGYEVYQGTVDFRNNLGSNQSGEVDFYLAPGISSKAYAVRWVVTELAYANGEVFMDYDATRKYYSLDSYTTEIGWQ